MIDHRDDPARSTHAVRGLSIALALIVAGIGRLLHAASDPAASVFSHLGHVMADAIPALPLGLTAVLGGRWLSRRTGVSRPAAIAFVLAAGFVPAGAVHEALAGASVAVHGHGAAAHRWSLAHGVRDAVPAFFAAFAAATLASFGSAFAAAAGRLRVASARVPRARIALALAALAATLPGRMPVAAASALPFSNPLVIPQERTGDDIAIEMREAEVQILPGAPTKMWTYDGTFPGPTIRRPSGVTTRVTFTNSLPEEAGSMTVHHHGNHSASTEDGQPASHLIPVGGSRTYTYDFVENDAPERAAMQWYHDHRMDVTGRNVWNGLAGMVILDDEVDADLPLPEGAFDVPLMFVDRSFDANNQLSYRFNANGVRGTKMLVNGVVQPRFDVAGAKYRLRLLNASNISEFTFAFADGTEMLQIATEGGLLPAPVPRTRIKLAPAERAEVVVDFTGMNGRSLVLQNVEGSPLLRQVMRFDVGPNVPDASRVPEVLRPLEPAPEVSIENTRVWALTQSLAGDLVWTINGLEYDAERIDTAPLNPVLGSAERWIFVNTTPVNHVMHIHDVDWWLIRRTSPDPYPADALLAEQGLKESFLVRPNEVVEIVSRFTDHLGTYVFHCHVLEHEDRAMMAQFEVVLSRP
ncbi:MAG TPA: multicopper oxidase family protein [Actinomycetota bacterium]|nr:multicopper oxidase family protein [Actinomycetota bacterium]